MSTYLVTGGAGFIGSHLVDQLIQSGNSVIVLDDLSSGKKSNINSDCEFIEGNITDTNLLNNLFDRIDFCYHLAAIVSVQKSIDDWLLSHNVNLGGTINIFNEAAKKAVPVIYASSAAIYGDCKTLPISENVNIKQTSPYGLDKYCCEMQARLFGDIHKLKTVGLRFFNVYGKRQDPSSPYSGVISIFSDRISKNAPIEVFGNGKQERDFIHVSDIVDGLVKAQQSVSSNAPIYNICTGTGTSINKLIDAMFDLSNITVDVNYLAARKGDILKSIGNPVKAKKDLNFVAKLDIKEGLKLLK